MNDEIVMKHIPKEDLSWSIDLIVQRKINDNCLHNNHYRYTEDLIYCFDCNHYTNKYGVQYLHR